MTKFMQHFCAGAEAQVFKMSSIIPLDPLLSLGKCMAAAQVTNPKKKGGRSLNAAEQDTDYKGTDVLWEVMR